MRAKQKANSRPATLPAPVGGWNARDSLGAMAPADAVYMVNYFPGTTDVMLRKGYTQHVTGITGQVESLMGYVGGATNKLFGAAGTSIYDVTSAGAVGAAVVTALTNARFQFINVATSANNYLMAVNGADKARFYTGAAWAKDGDGAPYDITVVNSANCIHINMHKNRVWLVEKNTLNAWYLPTGAIGGAATAFPLQGIASDGGYIMAMATWTIDAGYGVDDLAVFIISTGQVIVYRGTDPASATTWALVGVFEIGAPIGRRCFVKYAGDLVLMTQDGIVPLSGALQSSRTNPRVAITDKIQSAIGEAVVSYSANFGWQMIQYPRANMLLCNIPVAAGSAQQQFVMNTITKAWCNFTNWTANCWELFQDEPYFGSNGVVCKAWSGLSDNNTNINADCKQAFNYFGASGALKRFTMLRPIISSNGLPSVQANVNVDYEDATPTAQVAFATIPYGTWGVSTWGGATWGTSPFIQKQWQGVTGIGYCAAVRLTTQAKGISMNWISTDLVLEPGGIL